MTMKLNWLGIVVATIIATSLVLSLRKAARELAAEGVPAADRA